jgi:hypothetical protein
MVAASRSTGRLPLFALALGHGCADLSNSALLAGWSSLGSASASWG